MTNSYPQEPDALKMHNESERFLALEPTDTADRYLALAQWPTGSGAWARIVLTSQRVLRLEVTAGAAPSTTDGFLPRHAAAELARWRAFSQSQPSVGLPDSSLDRATVDVLQWARETTEKRLSSPLISLDKGRALSLETKRLTGGEIAYLYDAFVRIGDARPTETLAEKTGLTLAAARNRVYRARKEGLLSDTPRGEPGGWMTPRGWEEAQKGPHFPQLKRLVDGLLGRE